MGVIIEAWSTGFLVSRSDDVESGVADQSCEPSSKTGAFRIAFVALQSFPKFEEDLLPGVFEIGILEAHAAEDFRDERFVIAEELFPSGIAVTILGTSQKTDPSVAGLAGEMVGCPAHLTGDHFDKIESPKGQSWE